MQTLMSETYRRGNRIYVRCADDQVRRGTVTGHFREADTQMHVCVVEGAGRWDGWFSEYAVTGRADV